MLRPNGIGGAKSKASWGSALLALGIAASHGGAANAQAAAGGGDRFSMDLHSRISYESNIAGGDDTLAAARGVAPAEFLYTAGASVRLAKPSSRNSLFISGSVDFLRHEKNSNLDGTDYTVGAGAAGQLFGPCGGTAAANYSRHQTLTQDLTLPVTKNVVELKSVNAGVSCGRGGLVGGLQGSISNNANDAKNAGFVDSTTRLVSASVGYQNKSLGDVRLFTQYSKISYDNLPIVVIPGLINPSGVEQYGFGVSYARKIGQRLNGTGTLSYGTVKSGLGGSTNNLSADASLAYELSTRTRLQLGYSLSNRPSSTTNSDYVRSETFRVSGSYTLGSRIDLTAGGTYSLDNYRGGNLTVLQVRRSEAVTLFGAINVRVGQKVTLTLDAAHTERQADLPQFEFNSDRVSLGVTTRF